VKFQFEQALDACLAQLNTGADLEVVLSDFPECADELRPALAASEWMQRLAPPPERRHVSKDAFVAVVAERRRLVERVEGLVVEVKVGVPVTELLSRTAAPLKGVVCAAHAMHTDAVPMPSPELIASGKAAFMARVAQHGASRQRAAAPQAGHAAGTWRGIFGGLTAQPTLARRAVSSAVALAMTGMIGVTGLAQVSRAAASSLPGEALYQVKIIGQSARMMFQFDPAARSALQTEYAQRRLVEVEALVAAGRTVPDEAIEALLADETSMNALTDTQRGMLSNLIRSIARTDADLAARLRAVVGDPIDVDALHRGTDGMRDAILNRKPIEVQLPADEFTAEPVPVQADEPSEAASSPVVPVTGSPDEPVPPVSAPIVRGATDGDDDGAQPSDENGESQAGVGTSADPGSSGGSQEPPEDAPPPVPPHMQPNADPEPESPSGQP
jgi:hypothetical protein